MVKLTLYSLSGRFSVVDRRECDGVPSALAAAREHADSAGYTGVKLVDDGEFDGMRVTANPPRGRAGRNVARIDWLDDGEAE